MSETSCGIAGNPLSLSWLSGEPKNFKKDLRTSVANDSPEPVSTAGSSCQRGSAYSDIHRDSDYESVTLTRLRQAEERKRLAQQLAREDAD